MADNTKVYRSSMTAEEMEAALRSVPNKVSKDVIQTGFSSPTDDNVPSTKLLKEQLDSVDERFNSLGALSSKESVDLSKSEVVGVAPISKGGTGGATAALARQNLGVLEEDDIAAIVEEMLPEVDLSTAFVTGVLPISKGGSGAQTASSARTNYGVYSREEVDLHIAAALIKRIADSLPNLDTVNGGVWAPGQIFSTYNQYMVFGGEAYSPLQGTVLPYTVSTAPNLGFVYQVKLNSLQALSGLTEPSDLAQRHRIETTVAEIATGVFNDGDSLTVSDRANAPFDVESGGTSDGYGVLPAGLGLTAKLVIQNDVHNIKHYGAIDGAADNTEPMRAAMNAAGLAGGGFYFIPLGTWIHRQIDWRDKVIGWGSGFGAVDQRKSDPTNPRVTDVSYRFFNTDTVAPFDPELNLTGIKLYNINFKGTVEADAFSQYKHLLLMQGVTDLHADSCWFTGWQGDAVVVRSGNFTAAAQNNDVHITNSTFDGINNDNRNAITLNDFDGLWITGNTFRNCTRPDMPGAIDIEPNVGDTYVRLRNGYIDNNKFYSIGGNVAAIAHYLVIPQGSFTNGEPHNIQITNNVINGCFRGIQVSQSQDFPPDDSFENAGYVISGNVVTGATDAPFWYYGIKGLKAFDNHWRRCGEAGRVGWLEAFPNRGCSSVEISDTFYLSGYASGEAINLYNNNRVDIHHCTFDNIGTQSGTYGIPVVLKAGTNSRIKVNNSTIINSLGRTTGAVTIAGTLTQGGNEYIGNDFGSLGSPDFAGLCDFTTYGDNRVVNNITASPTANQASATQLNLGLNIVTTVISTNDSVKLPNSIGQSSVCTVVNSSATTAMKLFPFSGDNLGSGVNIGVAVAAGERHRYQAIDLNNWVRVD